MRDVGYHIVGALDTADRRRWEGALLQHYIDELRKHGVDAQPFDEMFRIYKASLAAACIIWLVNDTFFQPEAINTANAARVSAAMLELDAISVLDSL